jgi:hypothetical protein
LASARPTWCLIKSCRGVCVYPTKIGMLMWDGTLSSSREQLKPAALDSPLERSIAILVPYRSLARKDQCVERTSPGLTRQHELFRYAILGEVRPDTPGPASEVLPLEVYSNSPSDNGRDDGRQDVPRCVCVCVCDETPGATQHHDSATAIGLTRIDKS